MAEPNNEHGSLNAPMKGGRKRAGRSSDSPNGAPCGACKLLRKRCVNGCIFAPYFGPEQGTALFAAVHKIFGASNVSKLLVQLPLHHRYSAVKTLTYEAQARLADPVSGCVSVVANLITQVVYLHMELAKAKKLIAEKRMVAQGPPPQPEQLNHHELPPSHHLDWQPVYPNGSMAQKLLVERLLAATTPQGPPPQPEQLNHLELPPSCHPDWQPVYPNGSMAQKLLAERLVAANTPQGPPLQPEQLNHVELPPVQHPDWQPVYPNGSMAQKLLAERLMADNIPKGPPLQPEQLNYVELPPSHHPDWQPVYPNGSSASNNNMINMNMFDSNMHNPANDHQYAASSQPSFDPLMYTGPYFENDDDVMEDIGDLLAFADQF
ncbi:putative transcription factor AS2-LOB family [Helianthus annuus]|uniref:LOB domain-containing protein 13-like n=1 Tax=Helianthus annuus TaxID=4232 RepID=UPI001653353E|nr:LOB domain-containing protein 13-like [Helianthus annuus]KAJ0616486.1 putative transcription factor AS2-LOB family [Helianthus annuus]